MKDLIKLFFVFTLFIIPVLSSANQSNTKQEEILLPIQKSYSTNFVAPQYSPMASKWADFEKENGNWTVLLDNATKTPHRAFGKPIQIKGYSKITNSNVKQASLSFLRDNASTFNINVNDLKFIRATEVKNKWYVSFRQKYQNMEVLYSEIELRIFENAKVMAFGVSFYNDINIDPVPSIDYQKAVESSIEDFNGKTKNEIALLSNENAGKTFILPIKYKDKVSYKLVYDVVFRSNDPYGDYISYIDAHSGEVLYRKNMTMHMQKITSTGKVKMNNAHEDPVDVNFPYQHIMIGGEQYTSDENGELEIEITEKTPVEAEFSGEYCKAYFKDKEDAFFQDTLLPGEDLTIIWNDENSHPFERSVYYQTNRIHKWFKDMDPEMTSMDFPVKVQLLWSFPYGTNASCNYTGDTLSFWNVSDDKYNFSETPGILFHEYGHAVNFRLYMDLGVPRGMENMTTHEALADATACFILDDHRLGYGSTTAKPELYMRNLKNDFVFPDDIKGESHHDGQILGGAFWDLREATSLQYASEISHFARYGTPDDPNVGVAFSEWFIEVLIADDDDGDLTNGTPHFQEIVESFNKHQIGTALILSSNFSHEPLQDTEIYDQDFRVEFQMDIPDFPNSKPEEIKVIYSTDDWNTQTEIIATEYEEGMYYADIPAQSEPEVIQYYIAAKDNYTEEFKKLTLDSDFNAYLFLAGYYDYIYQPFESLGEWTIGADDDTAVNGAWQLGVPQGISIGASMKIQPNADHTEDGTKCMVTDPNVGYNFTQHMLGPGQTSFISPVYDLSNIEKPVILFYRWFIGFAFVQPNWPEDPYIQVLYRSDENDEWSSIYKSTDGEDDWLKVVVPIPEEVHGTDHFEVKFVANNTNRNNGVFFEALVDDFKILSASEVQTSVNDRFPGVNLKVYPNPFAESTSISCYFDNPQDVTIKIHDLLGNPVFTEKITNLTGYWMYDWDGTNNLGNELSSGVYILNMTVGNKNTSMKIIKQ